MAASRRLSVVGSIPGDPGGDDLAGWVRETAPRAVAYATSLLRDREKAEDVVQDCYCRLLSHADAYDLRADGLKLLLTSVSRACINLRTRARRWLPMSSGDGEPREFADAHARDPGADLLDRELSEQIGRGLATLPVRQRAALELRSMDHSLQEVAEILGISPTNAGVLIHRARAAMEAFLAPYLEGRRP